MEKIIYAIPSGRNNPETLLLVSTIRKFAGKYSKQPIWILIPKSDKETPKEYKKELEEYNALVISYEIDSEDAKFPFIDFVKAAATAERLASDKTEFLVWLDDNSLIINEPKDFILEKNINLGYRPVHHTLIGSIYDKPIDDFWDLIYKICNVKAEKIFSMKTHVDGNTLRAYFNAGFLIVRPQKGLLQKWWVTYKKEHNNPKLQEFYKKNERYLTFIHQAILTGIILSTLNKSEMKELPFEYNYPFHLYLESPVEYRYKNSNDLKTARIYLDKMLEPGMLNEISLQEPFKSWFEEKLKPLKKKLEDSKVKFGKVPLIFPIPIVLGGALVKGKPNFETLGDVGIMGINPPLVYISSSKDHYTNIGILEHNSFSINFPSSKLLAETDYCGVVSGRDVDKSQLFTVFFGELETAPMIQECPVNLECKVLKEFSIQHRQIFVAEVIQAYVNKEFVAEKDGRKIITDMKKLDPIIYALDNKYYSIGEKIGTGYEEYKKIKK